ncbi:Myosin-like protein, partial [Phytophthora palmivora]
MPAAEVDIDALRVHSPDLKYAATMPANSSNSTSSAASYKAYSVGDEEDIDDTYPAPTSAPHRGESFDYRRVQQASSFDVQEMINMRESTFRDSLMPGPYEMGNALMRIDTYPAPTSAPHRGESFDYRRVQQASSFDVQEMINMRESTFR